MNGVHDLGGMHGFGPIRRDTSAGPFHAPWEGRVCAMMRALIVRGVFNLDEMRRAIESLPPAEYLTSSYFERWLAAMRMLLVEKGVATPAELDGTFQEAEPGPEPPQPERHVGASRAGASVATTEQPAGAPRQAAAPRLKPGDPVVARNRHVKHHTRLPRYVRGKRGVIHRLHGVYDLPDASAHGLGHRPEPVYSVRFEARELWGDDATPNHSVYIDLWESYLDRA